MAKTRIELALEEAQRLIAALEDAVRVGSTASLTPTGAADGATIGMSSEEIIPADGIRVVELANLSSNQTVFLQRSADAVAEQGTVVFPGTSELVLLGNGQSLNAVSTAATTKLSWQLYE